MIFVTDHTTPADPKIGEANTDYAITEVLQCGGNTQKGTSRGSSSPKIEAALAAKSDINLRKKRGKNKNKDLTKHDMKRINALNLEPAHKNE